MDTIGDTETPASVDDVNVGGAVVQIAVDEVHTCVLLTSGAVRCWGSGEFGQLGYGNAFNIGDSETPASAGDVNVGGIVEQIAAGTVHTCALLTSGHVRCWGYAGSGQLGYGNTQNIGDDEIPASAGDVNIGGSATQVTAGAVHTCALLTSGSVRCWGDASRGQLGYGNLSNIGDNETPASAGDVNVGGPVVLVVAGGYHTCALLEGGSARCWGSGASGELGYGNTNMIGDNELPTVAGDVDVGGPIAQIATGETHTCALLRDGGLRCWGDGRNGRLGYAGTDDIGDNEMPSMVGEVSVGGRIAQITAADRHTCVLLSNGQARCWGDGSSGQLGYGNTASIGDNETPTSAGDVPYL